MRAFKEEYTSNPLRDLRKNIYIDGGQFRVRKKRQKILKLENSNNTILQYLGHQIPKALARE